MSIIMFTDPLQTTNYMYFPNKNPLKGVLNSGKWLPNSAHIHYIDT